MKTWLAALWSTVLPLLLSALVHSMDQGVGGVAGLARSSVLLSTVIFAAPLIALVLLSLWLRDSQGPAAAWGLLTLTAAAVAVALVVFGSTARTPLGSIWSFVGSFALVAAVLAAAVAPYFLCARPVAELQPSVVRR